MALLEHQSDKDIGEDYGASAATDDSSTDDEESFVQTRRNINDNNAEAAGNQMYPSGDSKYFDLFSWPGWINYVFTYYWY